MIFSFIGGLSLLVLLGTVHWVCAMGKMRMFFDLLRWIVIIAISNCVSGCGGNDAGLSDGTAAVPSGALVVRKFCGWQVKGKSGQLCSDWLYRHVVYRICFMYKSPVSFRNPVHNGYISHDHRDMIGDGYNERTCIPGFWITGSACCPPSLPLMAYQVRRVSRRHWTVALHHGAG